MTRVWVARLGDRIRVQLEPFDPPFPPPWELRAGLVPEDLVEAWAEGTGEHEAAIWDLLAPS